MFNDEDLKNDAIDGQIQAAIQRSRGNTLHGLAHPPGHEQPGQEPDLDDSVTNQMIAEDDAAEEEKKKGGGMGGIMDMVGSIAGG